MLFALVVHKALAAIDANNYCLHLNIQASTRPIFRH